MTDATINAPAAEATADGESFEDADTETAASVHVHSADGWDETRLIPGEAMEITLPDGSVVAVVEVDDDITVD